MASLSSPLPVDLSGLRTGARGHVSAGTGVFAAAPTPKPKNRKKSFEFVTSTAPGDFNSPKTRRKIFSHAMRSHLARQDGGRVRGRSGRWINHADADAVADAAEDDEPVVELPRDDSFIPPLAPDESALGPASLAFQHVTSAALASTGFLDQPSGQRPKGLPRPDSPSTQPSDSSETKTHRTYNWDSPERLRSLCIWPGHPSIISPNDTGRPESLSQIHPIIGSSLDPFDIIPYSSIGSGVGGVRFDELQHGCLVCGFGAIIQTKWFSALVRTDPLANTIGQLPWALNSALRSGQHEGDTVLALKLAALRAIQDALNSASRCYADLTLVAIASMLCYEIWKGDVAAMDSHRQGLHRLVRDRGGVFRLCGNFETACVVCSKFMSSSLACNRRPPPIYHQFSKSLSQPPYAPSRPPWPESPLFNPSGTLTHLSCSALCPAELAALLDAEAALVAHVRRAPADAPAIQSRAHAVYDMTLAYAARTAREPPRPGAPRQTRALVTATQLSALLLAAALAHRVTLRAALPSLARDLVLAAPLSALATAFRTSDFASLWGGYNTADEGAAPSMAGVLLFAGLVGAVAAEPPAEGEVPAADGTARRWVLTAALNPVVFTTTGYAEAYLGPLAAMAEVCAWLRGEDPGELGRDTEDEEGGLPWLRARDGAT